MFTAFVVLLVGTSLLAWVNERFLRIPTTVGVTLAAALTSVLLMVADAVGPGIGLRDTVEWYLSHPEWVSAIRKQQDFQSWLAQNYEKRENMT